MKLAMAAGLLGVTAAGVVCAQEMPGLITATKVNTDAQLAAMAPPRAVAEKVTGEAVLKCAITAQGEFADCIVATEEPAGYGFGDAALKAVLNERVKPEDDKGRPLAGRVISRGFTFLAPGDSDQSWLRLATRQETAAVYPREALKQGVDGRVFMACDVTVKGRVTDCKVTSETPAGMGFGAAALKLASKYRLKPTVRAGKPVPSTINIPLSWSEPERTERKQNRLR
jgi:TonB family protein